MLDLIVRQIVEPAQNQRLEHQNRIQLIAPGTGFPRALGLAPDLLQKRVERFPWHDLIDLGQRILLHIQDRRNPPAAWLLSLPFIVPQIDSAVRAGAIFGGALQFVHEHGW
jgi:hypothetical protein